MIVAAVVDAGARVPGHETVRSGSVAAVLDDHAGSGPAGLIAHAATIAQAFASCPAVLPTRASGAPVDGDAVTAWLRAEHDALLTALDRVRGRAEIAVTWRPDAPDVEAEAGDGAAYLRALAAGWHRAHSAGDRVRAAGALPGVVAVRVLVETPAVVKGSVLTRREDAGQVRQVLADEDFPGPWRASGPYAPYSFADGDWS